MDKSVRAAAWAVIFASSVAVAQPLPPPPEPERLRFQNPVPVPGRNGEIDPPIVDPYVTPAQQLLPPIAPGGGIPGSIPDSPRSSVPTGITTTPATSPPQVVEPPPPTVRVLVQTPAHVPPGKPVSYKVIVTNSAAAIAYRVRVRVPIPDGAESLLKAEPRPDDTADPKQLKEFVWEFKSLNRSEQKIIQLEYQPKPTAKEIRARAYVSFEHGQEVITQVEKPKLAVKKTANAQVARGDPVTVRVQVTNTGPMPIHKVRLVEEATAGFEFKGDTDSIRTQKTNQRAWELGSIGRGQSKIVTYQLIGGKQQGGELITTSNATSEDGGIAETAEAKTRILIPELGFALTGPASVDPRKPAEYEATVRNNGTLPLTNVTVTIPIPEDCLATKVTAGARKETIPNSTSSRVSWVIPKMPPGEAFKYRLSVTANTSGKRVVRATARDAGGMVQVEKDIATVFLGRADLHWSPDIPALIAVGKTGQISVKVHNDGEESDKGVSPRFKIPPGLTVVGTNPEKPAPTVTPDGEIVFNAVEIKAGATEVFTVTVKRVQPGQQRVGLRLEATSLGDRPLLKEQPIE